MTSARKPRVYVIGTGGSISRIGRVRTDYIDYTYKTGNYTIDELLARVPEVHELAEVRAEQFSNASSTDLGPADWLVLARRINQIFRDDSAAVGVAITHGTATLEETAYFLNLTVKSRKAVVVTGAMRPPTAISTDADLNILDCVRTAASPDAHGKGVLAMMNNEIHAAREVTKTDGLRVQTMRSRPFGILGYSDADGQVVFYRQPVKTHTADSEFDVATLLKLPRVEIVPAYAGADGLLIDLLVKEKIPGIVAAGLGSGSGPSAYMLALDEAVKRGVKVMLATQAGSGRVVRKQRFLDGGYIVADNLTPKKARILLMLALSMTNDTAEIQRMAFTY